MRVAYVNHTGLMSGAERSLLPLLQRLPEGMEPLMLCPDGAMGETVAGLGVPVIPIPAVEAGMRLHPLRTTMGTAAIAAAALRVRGICRRHRVELVHANSTRAGLIAAGARAIGGPPVVVSVHDALPKTALARLTRRAIQRRAAAVVACTRYIANSFGGPRTRVVYYGVELERQPDPGRAKRIRAELGLSNAPLVLGIVGQITPWKGQDTAIRALAEIRRTMPGATLLLAGEVKFVGRGRRHDNRAYERSLKALRDRLGLGDAIRFLGERRDVPDLLGALDLLLAPSWQEPGGVAVQEAMLAGTPAIVTSVGGLRELIEDDVSGRLVDPHDHLAWAQAILELAPDPDRRARMAEAAKGAIAAFTPERFVRETVRVYQSAIEAP